MKITRMEILPADVGKLYIFVKLHTDEGICGVGEPSCVGKEHAVIGALRDLEHFIVDANPFEIERLWNNMYRTVIWRGGPVLTAALSGVEHALWDIKARAPQRHRLGGGARRGVRPRPSMESRFAQKAVAANRAGRGVGSHLMAFRSGRAGSDTSANAFVITDRYRRSACLPSCCANERSFRHRVRPRRTDRRRGSAGEAGPPD